MEMILTWGLVLLSSAIFILCDSLSAYWGKTDNPTSLVIFIGLSPMAYIAFALLNKKMDLAIAGSLVNLFILVGAVLVGVLYFGDVLTTRHMIGLIFAVIAVILLGI